MQAFKQVYDNATVLVEQYNRDLAAWEQQVNSKEKPLQKPPEKESVLKRLRELDAEAKRQNSERQRTAKKSRDWVR